MLHIFYFVFLDTFFVLVWELNATLFNVLIWFILRPNRPKYGITEQRTSYKGVMRLTIRSFSSADVGTYHCVSTNSLGRAEGTLRLYGKMWLLSCIIWFEFFGRSDANLSLTHSHSLTLTPTPF